MDEQYCDLHGVRLVEDSVPIIYGTFAPEPPQVIAERANTYPFANEIAKGPCWVESETHRKVLFCPVCREAWQRTPAARQLDDYLAREKPSYEEEIARLQAQHDRNRRDKLIFNLAQIVWYALLGAAIGAGVSYFKSSGLAFGAALGGAGGAIMGVLTRRKI